MENYQKIELYQRRSFSEKLNVAFAFLRQNAGPFLKAQFAISGPVAVIAGILYSLSLVGMLNSINTQSANYAFSSQYASSTGVSLLVYFLLGISIYLVTFSYLKLYVEGDGAKPSISEVFHLGFSKLGYAILAMVMIYIVVFMGVVLLIIPGIYFGVICTLVFPIMVMEDVSPGAALQRAFYLIKDKWWSTFGLLFVTGILAYIITLVLALPLGVFTMISAMLSIENTGETTFGDTYFWVFGASSMLTYLGTILGGSIVQLALAFQYGNFIETKESRGLLREIEELGNEEKPSANEGEY